MTLRWMVAMLTAGLAGCVTLPRAGKPAMADVQFRMREFRLANGMRLIVEEDHASPVVGVFTVVGVGSSSDPAGREGLAHLVEHLAFRAKPGGKRTAFSQLEEAGVGTFNAMTSFDETVYLEAGARELLPTLLALEAGRLFDPLVGVDQKTFEVEREVVRNELRQRGENAIGPSLSALQAAAFPKEHPYSRPIAGTHESLSSITFEDAKAFAARHYRPENITLLIIGDVDLGTIHVPLIQALPTAVFKPLPMSSEPFPARLPAQASEPPEAPVAAQLIKTQSTVASPELYLVWTLPRGFDEHAVMLDFVTVAANGALGKAFITDPDIAGVSVTLVPGVEASMLIARATLHRGDHVERSYERLLDQLVRLWASGEAGQMWAPKSQVSEALELEQALRRLRGQALVGMVLGAEDIVDRGLQRVQAAHFTGNPVTYGRRLRAMGSVTPGQLSHFAERYLQRSRARGVLVEPFSADAKAVASGPTGLEPVEVAPMSAALTGEAVKQLGRAHAAPPSREHLVDTLPNGLKVVVHRRRDSLPVAVVQLTFATGWAGTMPRRAAELAEGFAWPREHRYGRGIDFGIRWQTKVEADRSTILGTGASGNLPNLLAQLSERVTSMRVEPGSFAFYQRELEGVVAQAEQLPLFKSERALDATLFHGHPIGEGAMTSDIEGLTETQLDEWFRRAWTPDNAVLVVTGDLDAEATLAGVKEWLGSWRPAENPFPRLPPPPVRKRAPATLVTHQPGATQAQVHLACLVDEPGTIDTLTARTTADLLKDALSDRIRRELGGSYGFHGRASMLVGGVARLDWTGSIENPRLTEALGILSHAVGELDTQTISEQAVARARWGVARSLTMSTTSSLAVADTLSRHALAGHDTDTSALFGLLATIGRPRVLELWSQCRGSLTFAFVGDEALLRQALSQTTWPSMSSR